MIQHATTKPEQNNGRSDSLGLTIGTLSAWRSPDDKTKCKYFMRSKDLRIKCMDNAL